MAGWGRFGGLLVVTAALVGCGSPKLVTAPFGPSVALTQVMNGGDLGTLKPLQVIASQDKDDFTQFDADADGKLTKDEFANGMFEQTYGRKPSGWKRAETRKN